MNLGAYKKLKQQTKFINSCVSNIPFKENDNDTELISSRQYTDCSMNLLGGAMGCDEGTKYDFDAVHQNTQVI